MNNNEIKSMVDGLIKGDVNDRILAVSLANQEQLNILVKDKSKKVRMQVALLNNHDCNGILINDFDATIKEIALYNSVYL